MPTLEARRLAKEAGLNLVEIAGNANPPVCRIVDYGKFRYEQSKKKKESKKQGHANKVKEIQLRPNIDPHDFQTKVHHAVDFLCEDMKIKVALRFRGREMAHQEIGFRVVKDFVAATEKWGQPDFEPKMVGRGIALMISPLPRTKRAPHPDAENAKRRMAEHEENEGRDSDDDDDDHDNESDDGDSSKS